MAQIKYIRRKSSTTKVGDEAAPEKASTAKKGATAAASAAKSKTKANTKAKIVQYDPEKAEMKAAARKAKSAKGAETEEAATKPVARGRGRPKQDASAAPATKGRPKGKTAAAAKGKATTKKTTTAKAAAETVASSTAPKASRKRKAATDEEPSEAPVKKVRTLTKGPVLQEPPTQKLNVYVFGTGDGAELGLGSGKKSKIAKVPRLNPHLSDKVGIVQVAAGGMHSVALTADNKILTWGVNDEGALGRDTNWDGGWKDVDANEDSDEDEAEDDGSDLNPKESTPTEVDWSTTLLAEGARFVQVTAGDSASFALTDDGLVYGWGTFRDNAGATAFAPDTERADRPMLIEGLKKIVQVKAGANHAVALDSAGVVFAWGTYEQSQLGRRIVERTKHRALIPLEVGLPKGSKHRVVAIETGAYHNFALSKLGEVYAWGLNNYGETGIATNAGQDDAFVVPAQVVKSLRGKKVVTIKGGAHHSLAATEDGDCLIWGRIDGHQMGIPDEKLAEMPDDVFVKDEYDRRRILAEPQKVPIEGTVTAVATSSDHNVIVTKEGKAWAWGFSSGYQTGLATDDDVVAARLLKSQAVAEVKFVGAATGGQFSILTAAADSDSKTVNGA